MGLRGKTLSIVAVVAGALFAFLGLQAKADKKTMDEQGISVPGTITSAEVQRTSKKKKRHIIRVNWGEGAMRKENDLFPVTKSFFQSRVQGESTVTSPEVTVKYLPGQPDSAIIEGGSSNFLGMEWLGGIVGAAGIVGCWRGFLARR